MLRVNLFITSSSADPSLCCCCYFLLPRFFAAGLLFPETVGRHPRFRRDCGSRQREAKPNRRVGSREDPTPERIANNIRWLNRCQPPVDDAKRDTPLPGVEMPCCAKVDLVREAMPDRPASSHPRIAGHRGGERYAGPSPDLTKNSMPPRRAISCKYVSIEWEAPS